MVESRWDAVVIGGGIAGLSAAWEFCRAGLRPLVVEARGYVGGLIAGGRIAGVEMDLGAEGFVNRGEAVAIIAQALDMRIIEPQGGGSRLFLPPLDTGGATAGGATAGWALHPMPSNAVLGIPADPLAPDVVETIGIDAARVAAQDADMDPEIGQDQTSLAGFVEARMGPVLLDRLVRPLTAGIYTADPTVLSVDVVAPGLRARTLEAGSLSAAVASMRAAAPRAAGDVSVEGGMFRLVRGMADRIIAAGGSIRTRTGARSLKPLPDVWSIDIGPTAPNPNPSLEPIPDGEPETILTTRLVVAASQSTAVRLLSARPSLYSDIPVLGGSPIARSTIVVRCPGLSERPIGQGLLVAPSDDPPVRAKACSHLSVKWPRIGNELRELHGPDVHALRMSYGRPGEEPYQPDLDRLLADASTLTGLALAPEDVIEWKTVRWDGSLPPRTPEHRERTARLLEQVDATPGLAVCGAWVAGSGVTSAVAQARAQARRLTGDPA